VVEVALRGLFGLFIAAGACLLFGRVLFGYDSSIGYAITQLERILSQSMWPLFLGVTTFSFIRKRLKSPGLADVVAMDTRPPVLYLRAFRHEFEPFAYVLRKEMRRYTQREVNKEPAVTFEQYFGAEFVKQLGPFIALGDPLDSVPPEGAARSYVPDEDWQRHFSTHATAAAAIVVDGSLSNSLYWELSEVTRNGWQCKLFFFTCPASPQSSRTFFRIMEARRRPAKGLRPPMHWEQLAAGLKDVGLHMPPVEPDPGSVIAFDVAGRTEVLIRGAQKPEEFVDALRTYLR
jgi:hypothetical protein